HEAEERVEREPAVGDRVAEPSVELWLTVAEDGAVVRGDLPVPVEIGDLVLARRAGSLIGQVARGARVALLPQAGDLIAVNRAERLAHPHDIDVAGGRVEEIAGPRGEWGKLEHGHCSPRRVRPGPELEHLVGVVREGQRATPGDPWARDVDGRERQLHAVVL